MLPAPALAVVALGLAAALTVPGAERVPGRRGRLGVPAVIVLGSVGVVVFGGAGVHAAEMVVVAGALAGCGVGGWVLWRSRAARLSAAATSARVVEACEQVASELAAGLPPGPALERAAAEWPALEPVAEAVRMDADVSAAWREVARAPGAEELRLVAAAWHLAHQTGQGLADALEQISHDLRASAATRRVVEGELASARATARLVALLPVAALAMGSGVGGSPFTFLLHTPVGLAALVLGLAFGWLGLWWIELIARGAAHA